ncbi:hypothetical protein TWF694_005441 [Orbilia ellipsospora]|uniref:F-box domain-containing protein n=1 Tax=Orbilia ellipsospora TaxID=2528407 RepID=A0AAV9WU77_9PEZI
MSSPMSMDIDEESSEPRNEPTDYPEIPMEIIGPSIGVAHDEQFHMFVNLDRKQVIKYPISVGERHPTTDLLFNEQWAIRKGFSELMLLSGYRDFEKEQITYNTSRSPSTPRRLSRADLFALPDELIVRIIRHLHPATCLLLACTCSRLLELSLDRITKIIWPDHVGYWAGSRIEFVNGFVASKYRGKRFFGLASSSARSRLLHYCNEFTEVQAPRTIWTGEDPVQTNFALQSIINEAGTRRPIPLIIKEYAQRAMEADEIWLTFNQFDNYVFYDHASEATASFDVAEYVSPNGPDDLKAADQPTSIFSDTIFLYDTHSIILRAAWAGKSVSVGPYMSFEVEDTDWELGHAEEKNRQADMIASITRSTTWDAPWRVDPTVDPKEDTRVDADGDIQMALAPLARVIPRFDPQTYVQAERLIWIRHFQLLGWTAIFGAHLYIIFVAWRFAWAAIFRRFFWRFR